LYICLYAVKVFFSAARDFIVKVDVVTHRRLHIGPEFIYVQMYLCVMFDFYQHMGVDHRPPRQLKLSTGQGVYRLDTVLGVVTWHKKLQPDIWVLIEISLPSCIESLEVCLFLRGQLID